jgi:hypothetical protein
MARKVNGLLDLAMRGPGELLPGAEIRRMRDSFKTERANSRIRPQENQGKTRYREPTWGYLPAYLYVDLLTMIKKLLTVPFLLSCQADTMFRRRPADPGT